VTAGPARIGALLLLCSAALYLAYTRPVAAEADALRASFQQARLAAARDSAETAQRTRRLALWNRAARSSAAGAAANPTLVLRRQVLAVTARAGIRDVQLDVAAAKPPFGASARISGSARFAAVSQLLDALDPEQNGFVIETAALSQADEDRDIAYSIELAAPEAPTDAVPTEAAAAPPVSPRKAAAAWGRDPFRFGAAPEPPAAAADLAFPRPRRATTPEGAATPQAPPNPALAVPVVRLVGLVRRGTTLLAVLGLGSQIGVLGAGATMDGYTVVSVAEDRVVVRTPAGAEQLLEPPN
jgi:hypothetical protein